MRLFFKSLPRPEIPKVKNDLKIFLQTSLLLLAKFSNSFAFRPEEK